MNTLLWSVWHEIRPRSIASALDSAKQTGRYLMETEVHVYGFSIAASVLLAFMPFLVVIASLCRHVFGLPAAEQALYFAIRDLFPDDVGKAISFRVQELLYIRGPLQFTSMFCSFLPPTASLNRWKWRLTGPSASRPTGVTFAINSSAWASSSPAAPSS